MRITEPRRGWAEFTEEQQLYGPESGQIPSLTSKELATVARMQVAGPRRARLLACVIRSHRRRESTSFVGS